MLTRTLNKNIPITTSIAKTNNNKYHIIINGRGGIATANIYHAHFNDNHSRYLTKGISHSEHRSADTFQEAIRYFQSWCPHCETQAHIDFMNLNAPLEVSNLNNPCPRLRQLIHNYEPNAYKPNTDGEKTWLDNTSHPEIGFNRLLASQRASNSSFAFTGSYDFFDSSYAGPRVTSLNISAINLNILQTRGTTDHISRSTTSHPPTTTQTPAPLIQAQTTTSPENISHQSIQAKHPHHLLKHQPSNLHHFLKLTYYANILQMMKLALFLTKQESCP